MVKICQIYRGASLYRESIYTLLGETYDTDWVFSDNLGDIKLMDTSKLKGCVYECRYKSILGGKAYLLLGIYKYIFKPYSHYIILGDERCLSYWFFLFLSSFFPKKKIYVWSHGVYGKEGPIKQMIQKLFYSFTDGVFLYGNYAKDIMIQRGFNPQKLFVLHNSLNYATQLKLRNSNLLSPILNNHFGNDNPIVIFIGRLTTVKRLDQLLDAIAKVNNSDMAVNLVIVGKGEEEENLRLQANEIGINDNIWFFGECYDERTNAQLIYNSDLCVAPGNVGLTAMHCLMFGCPVITHNCFQWQMPEFEAIKKNITGDFFEYNNVDSLSNCIKDWLLANRNKREVVRKECYREIDSSWTPEYQIKIFKSVI